MKTDIHTEDNGRRHKRELLVDGEHASRLWVVDHKVRLAGTRVSMGGIAGVRTEPEHRKKGYMRRLMSDTVAYMTERGYAVSMLFGIPDFYNKFGYLPALPEHHATIATRDAERACSDRSPGVRSLTDEDYPFVIETSSAAGRERPASLVRTAETFRGFRRGSGWDVDTRAFIVEDGSGKPVAYFVLDDRSHVVRVTELGAPKRTAFPALLCRFAQLAIERRCGEIEVHLPPDNPFVEYMQRFGCVSRLTRRRMGGGMMRILNQHPLFEALRPGLERRLQRGPLAGRPVTLRIDTDLGVTELGLNHEATGEPVAAAIRPGQNVLTQLLVGYRTAADVLADPDTDWEGEAHAVTSALFDGRPCPYVWYADRF
ncbi:MAG: GNAT family N-acetyltransferase [Candidatus Brocadiia bacterium]